MKLLDVDEILSVGCAEWLCCVLCGRATKEHPSCDGACDYTARQYAEKAFEAMALWIAEAPTIDAEPVRHGHWIHTGITNIYGGHQHECSVCGYSLIVSPLCDNENYCCSCGAKMDEVTE